MHTCLFLSFINSVIHSKYFVTPITDQRSPIRVAWSWKQEVKYRARANQRYVCCFRLRDMKTEIENHSRRFSYCRICENSHTLSPSCFLSLSPSFLLSLSLGLVLAHSLYRSIVEFLKATQDVSQGSTRMDND